jgi:hypothetical protein
MMSRHANRPPEGFRGWFEGESSSRETASSGEKTGDGEKVNRTALFWSLARSFWLQAKPMSLSLLESLKMMYT